jgi:hypothetical protein
MSNTIRIAIDPGVGGAMAVQYPDGSITAHEFDCEATMRDELENVLAYDGTAEIRAVLERVHSMPAQGVSSTFKLGANYGYWRGVLQGLRIPFREVIPQKWQRAVLVPGKLQGPERKRALKQVAQERFPKLKVTLKTADALLMLNEA